ncbi:transcriptional regulator, TetR family [Paenibacillus uliginis N3/975]|uniref:Transcriptional regulator, TetR family n=1 Tax=Paenibacillus uliginis N3/975 TaxID=1313296 RepID=A0A1X7HRN7_9BACL|nr:TetR family transcriptional regulator [Paenibacillus uliginis]SMF91498.1 transcriptional regulator, TetR family [Paenibacillus uliginis N3/975]
MEQEQPELDVKTRILMSAKKLFAKQGFEGTSVRQICDDASVNIALVSYHFGGKDKMFTAIFEQLFPGYDMDQYKERMDEPVSGLAFAIHEIVKYTLIDTELSDIVQQELTMRTPRKEVVLSFLRPVWSAVKQLLDRGKSQGKFHFESSGEALLMVMGVCLSHKLMINNEPLLGFKDADPELISQQAIQFIFKGLGVEDTK